MNNFYREIMKFWNSLKFVLRSTQFRLFANIDYGIVNMQSLKWI